MQPDLTTSRWTARRLTCVLRRRARLGLFALAWLCCALLAVAGTTQKPRHRALPVQEPQGSAQAKPPAQTKPKSGSQQGKKIPAHPQSEAAPKRAVPHTTPHAKRRPHPADDDNPDPATMVRVRHHALPACRRAHCSVTVALPRKPSLAETRAAARAAAQQAAAKQAALRSAQIAANIEASVRQAQARKAVSTARDEASLQPPAPVVRMPPPARRVDGFGAEGAVLAAPTERAVLSRGATALPELPEDPALLALAHPSRSELAEEAVEPQVLPQLYSASGRWMPAPLTGSHEVLVHQNVMADDEGLSRIRNDAELNHLRAEHLLVDFPVSEGLRVNPELAANRRCARPWTVRFAADVARAFYARFHQPLQVTSAVRTVSYQLRLQRINGNAAAVEGEAASPHLTGQAIDFGKRGMSAEQLAWMRAFLLPLMNAGKIDVEEEFQQACFHISVYRSYLPPPRKRTPPRTEVAMKNREQGLGIRD